MKIRSYQTEDIKQLKKLYLALYDDYQNSIFPEELRKYEEFNDLYKTINYIIDYEKKSANWKTFVAEADQSELIGFIAGTIQVQDYYKLNRFGMIESFFIKENYRGQGIGLELLTRLEKWFKVKN